jgi:hypothetical protein
VGTELAGAGCQGMQKGLALPTKVTGKDIKKAGCWCVQKSNCLESNDSSSKRT